MACAQQVGVFSRSEIRVTSSRSIFRPLLSHLILMSRRAGSFTGSLQERWRLSTAIRWLFLNLVMTERTELYLSNFEEMGNKWQNNWTQISRLSITSLSSEIGQYSFPQNFYPVDIFRPASESKVNP